MRYSGARSTERLLAARPVSRQVVASNGRQAGTRCRHSPPFDRHARSYEPHDPHPSVRVGIGVGIGVYADDVGGVA